MANYRKKSFVYKSVENIDFWLNKFSHPMQPFN